MRIAGGHADSAAALSESTDVAAMVSSANLPPVAGARAGRTADRGPIEQSALRPPMNTTIWTVPVTLVSPAYWLEDPPVQLRRQRQDPVSNWLLARRQVGDDRTITLRLRPA